MTEFEKANPSIKVQSVEYQWTGPTFAAKLAAGTLPTVFTVPFTDARTQRYSDKLLSLLGLAAIRPALKTNALKSLLNKEGFHSIFAASIQFNHMI